jgi:hypothetical protein
VAGEDGQAWGLGSRGGCGWGAGYRAQGEATGAEGVGVVREGVVGMVRRGGGCRAREMPWLPVLRGDAGTRGEGGSDTGPTTITFGFFSCRTSRTGNGPGLNIDR